jgi:outer membrane immunogenic protein
MGRIIGRALAVLLVIGLAGPAVAADLRKPIFKAPPASVAPFSWTGIYIGLNGGYGWGNAQYSDPFIGSFSKAATGWLGGGTVGYNLQTNSWVLGVEGDLDASSIMGTNTSFPTCAFLQACQARNDWFGTVRGRLGYALDRVLVFATGGAAFGDLKLTNPFGVSETHNTNVGWVVGGGVEYAFQGPWSIKAEYLYADLGNVGCSPATCGPNSTVKLPMNITRLGVNYRF